VNTDGQIIDTILENGRKITCGGWVSMCGQMEKLTKENTKKIKKKAMESTNGLMGGSIKAGG
jgi:hypothetical protein